MAASVDKRNRSPQDPAHFRRTLGQYPTGVCVITAMEPSGKPVGMTVGSFTSVSLEPPLVAFFPAATSRTWPRIRAAGSFCVNFLTAEQEFVCRACASETDNRLADLSWTITASGAPLLDGGAGWIDCGVEQVLETGDHVMVLGRVRDLDVGSGAAPLVFYQGGYGQFRPGTLATAELDLVALPMIDIARAEMQVLTEETGIPCGAQLRSGEDLVTAATAGAWRAAGLHLWIGTRVPFVLPYNNVWIAWAGDSVIEACLSHLPEGLRDRERAALAEIRARGYSVLHRNEAGLELTTMVNQATAEPQMDVTRRLRGMAGPLVGAYTPEYPEATPVVGLKAPVFGRDGTVVMAILLIPLPEEQTPDTAAAAGQRLVDCATAVSRLLLGDPVRPAA